ncbi:hypothetical protein [Nocardia sp. NPDC019395]|uniref:hypothetical protein n=1 Tax=Nocardia sp. NPDC019395 TaxID=3154686 RepID=UPI0033EFF581
MAYAKLKYDGNSYDLDTDKAAEFLEELRYALLSDKPKLIDAPLIAGKTVTIAVSIYTPVAIERNAPAGDNDKPKRRVAAVL